MREVTPAESESLHGLLGEVARREPDRIALREGASTLTFSELWTQTGRLASRLVETGVKPHEVVVVALPRSIDLVVACFGILRAGGVALPLDLRAPPLRNRRLVDTARARWGVVRGRVSPECVGHIGAINVESPKTQGPVPELPADSARDAFLIFTSGSTGAPKGVRLSHGALVTRSSVEREAYGFTSDDLYLIRTSPAFVGLAVGLSLLAGGVSAVVAGDEVSDQAADVVALIRSVGVTFAPFSPRLIETLLALPDIADSLPRLRVVRSAGEPLSPELAARFHKALPACRLVDGYGTTETSGVVVSADVVGPMAQHGDPQAGTPLAGVLVRLVGADEQPAQEGEIWVATPMLAAGYFDGKDDEDPRFVVEPGPPGGPEVRWYRTGDRGRLSSDGRVMVLGRIDLQLNIDGVRVEPEEIESALRLHEGVEDAAVWAHPDASGRPRLVAYIVEHGAPASVGSLRTFLSSSLPAALIPTRFVRVKALPLTPSGKVARASLPDPGAAAPSATAPRNETESSLLDLFREVLGVKGLGVDDDFFEWGGDSLRAVDLMTRVAQATSVRLSAAVILNAPTVSDLAKEVAKGDPGQVSTVWLRRAGRQAPIVCLPGLAGDPLWFLPLIGALDPQRPLLGLSFVGLDPPITISAAASRGVEALRAVQPGGPYFLLGHSLGGVLAFEMARELQRAGETLAFVGLIDTHVPGRPRAGRLSFAARLFHELKRRKNRAILAARLKLKAPLSLLGVKAETRVSMFVPGLRTAALSHRVSPCDVKVTLFRANERSLTSDLPADWAPLALGGVDVVDIPGHHFDLLSGGRARELSLRIAGALARASTSSPRATSSPSP